MTDTNKVDVEPVAWWVPKFEEPFVGRGPTRPVLYPDSKPLYDASALAALRQEPDWTDSETLPSEIWKNSLYDFQTRLQVADGTVAFRDKIIANLRTQLAVEQAKVRELVKVMQFFVNHWYDDKDALAAIKKYGEQK